MVETELLRDDYRHLSERVEKLKLAADLIGYVTEERVRLAIDEAYDFLVHELIPHSQAQEAALYPVIGWLLRASEATATMSKDHDAISLMTGELKSTAGLPRGNQPYSRAETT
jgi:iron-sulfur cluster repair protein YtfE (RIC family)